MLIGKRPMLKARKPAPEPPVEGERRFASSEVSRLSGVSLRQLQWWDERKVVTPRHEGHRRLYSPEDVLEIGVIAELRRKGFSLQKIRRVLRFLQREHGKRLSELSLSDSDLHLLTDGKSIYLEQDSNRIVDLMKNSRQPMFLVCVSDQARRITATVDRPARKPAGTAQALARRAARSG